MAAPSQREEMAQWAVTNRSATGKLACQAFGISQTCYRYYAKLEAERLIADDVAVAVLLPLRVPVARPMSTNA